MTEQTDQISREAKWAYKKILYRRMGRLTVYYTIACVLFTIALKLFPGLLDVLPIGGISEYSDIASVNPRLTGDPSLDQTILTAPPPGSWGQEVIALIIAMVTTLILMIPVSWVFRTIHSGHEYDHSIDETTLVLPSVVAGIVTIVQHSLALAFSLAGIVAAVRFRRALNDTFDTLFIFVAIGVGLAAGVGAIETAVAITVFFNYATLFVCSIGEGLESQYITMKTTAKIEQKAKIRSESLQDTQPRKKQSKTTKKKSKKAKTKTAEELKPPE